MARQGAGPGDASRWPGRLRAAVDRLAAGPAAARARDLAAGLSYHRREIVLVALVAACLLGGLVIERGRAAVPLLAARLEVEPPPPRPPVRPPGPRRRPAEPRPPGPPAASARPGRPPPCEPRAPGWVGPLDLNRATGPELAALPGFGPRLAVRVLARREALGGRFETIADLAAVAGVGRQRAETLAPWVAIGPPPVPPAGVGPADRRPPASGPDGDLPARAAPAPPPTPESAPSSSAEEASSGGPS